MIVPMFVIVMFVVVIMTFMAVIRVFNHALLLALWSLVPGPWSLLFVFEGVCGGQLLCLPGVLAPKKKLPRKMLRRWGNPSLMVRGLPLQGQTA
jgi:hypothetical protein